MTVKQAASVKQLLVILASVALTFSPAIVGFFALPYVGRGSLLVFEALLFALGSLMLLASTGRLKALSPANMVKRIGRVKRIVKMPPITGKRREEH
ncbi:MAG: hypothetical protein QXK12_01215 [Candidatus Nezhaarchaeales archaeon]